MKMTKKLLSVLLAVIMAFSSLAVVSFAEEETDYDARVDGWNANYELFLDHLFDDNSFTSWKYVDINKKAMSDTMTAWTALSLYDEAWRNYATHHISIEQAELILLALIEKAEYNFDDGYVDKFVEILELAQDANDFIQKVEDLIKADAFTNVVKSEAWGMTFDIIGNVTKIAHAYQTYRDQFIEEYSRVLSVQLANQYYIDLLHYIADTTTYDILKTAANNLIANMEKSVKEVIGDVLVDAVGDGVQMGLETLVNLAADSNVYTAAILKVYKGFVSVAEFLWNTDEVYPNLETVMAAYYFQDSASDWAYEAYYQEEAEKSYFAIDLLITTRKVCEQALCNLKLAEDKGAVGKVKNKLHGTLFEDTEVNLCQLEIMRNTMFNLEIADFKKVTDSIVAYCPVSVDLIDNAGKILFTIKDGEASKASNDKGIFYSIYSEYSGDYLKVIYLYDSARVRLNGNKDGYVTLIHKELLDDGKVEDWSFTDVVVAKETKIVFDTDQPAEHTYVFSKGGSVSTAKFNDKFQESQYPEYKLKDVVDAGGEIVKDEAKSFLDIIKDFFAKIGDFFRNLFKGKK